VTEDGLTIRDVTRRTGVEAATLRIWEQRHGFPEPQRLPSGHRRYSHLDVELIRQVTRDRESGLELKAAIENVKRAARGDRPVIEDDSIFSGLRKRRPDLQSYLLTKSTLISVSHAIEDECSAVSRKAMLFGSFQRERFYRSAEPRWRDLAASAECAFVLADFDQLEEPGAGRPVEVPIDKSEPVGREWSLVYDAPAFGAVLSGWERPGQDGVPDMERRFEALWSVEPELVRDASTVAYGIVERVAPDVVEGIEDLLARPVEPQQPSLTQLTALTNRMVAYVGGAGLPGA
jgi:DICT domain-containing protein